MTRRIDPTVAPGIGPAERSAQEQERVLEEGRHVVAKARANAAGLSTRDIQQEVDEAVKEVRRRAERQAKPTALS